MSESELVTFISKRWLAVSLFVLGLAVLTVWLVWLRRKRTGIPSEAAVRRRAKDRSEARSWLSSLAQIEQEERDAIVFLGLAVLTLFVLSVLFHVALPEVHQETKLTYFGRRLLTDITLHIAIAGIVAIVILATVDISSKRKIEREIDRYKEAIAKEVWSAVFARFLPKSLVDEIEGLVSATGIWEECWYTITLHRWYEGLPNDVLVLRRQAFYRLRNITHGPLANEPVVRSQIVPSLGITRVSQGGVDFELPRHVELMVNDAAIPLKDALDSREPTLMIYRKDLAQQEHVSIRMTSEEVVGHRDRWSFVVRRPVQGLTIALENDCGLPLAFSKPQLNHPRRERLEPKGKNSYYFDGVLLPGQGFTVSFGPPV